MTTDTDKASDKLVEMAKAAGIGTVGGEPTAYPAGYTKLAAFRAAIIADLCGDVEPVALMFQHNATGRIAFVDTWQKNNGWATANPRYKEVGALHGASTVAALKSRADALAARVVELKKDAWRLDAVEANRFEIHNPYKGSWVVVKYQPDSCRFMEMKTGASTVRAAIDAALAAKGQAS